jgi:hypothetical protein
MHILLDLGLPAQSFKIGYGNRRSRSDKRRARAQSHRAGVRMPKHSCAAQVTIWWALSVIHKY